MCECGGEEKDEGVSVQRKEGRKEDERMRCECGGEDEDEKMRG